MGDAECCSPKVNLHVCTIQVSLVLSLFSRGGNMVWKDKFYLQLFILNIKYTQFQGWKHISKIYIPQRLLICLLFFTDLFHPQYLG